MKILGKNIWDALFWGITITVLVAVVGFFLWTAFDDSLSIKMDTAVQKGYDECTYLCQLKHNTSSIYFIERYGYYDNNSCYCCVGNESLRYECKTFMYYENASCVYSPLSRFEEESYVSGLDLFMGVPAPTFKGTC